MLNNIPMNARRNGVGHLCCISATAVLDWTKARPLLSPEHGPHSPTSVSLHRQYPVSPYTDSAFMELLLGWTTFNVPLV